MVRVPVRQCEVDSDRKADLAAAKNKIKERIAGLDLKLRESEGLTFKGQIFLTQDTELLGALLDLSQGQVYMADILMFTALLRLKELNLENFVNISGVHQIGRQQVDHVPVKDALLHRLGL